MSKKTVKQTSSLLRPLDDESHSRALAAFKPKHLSQDEIMGEQLTAHYEQAVGGLAAALVVGAMMIKVEEVVSTCGHNPTRGPQTKGDGMKAWLEKFAPKVNRSTAYRFRDLAKGVQENFKLGKQTDLALLLTSDELDATLGKKKQAILDFIEGKSQRQLLLEFGDHRKPKGGDTTPRCEACDAKIKQYEVTCHKCGKPTGQEEEPSYDPSTPAAEAHDSIFSPIQRAKLAWTAMTDNAPLWTHLSAEDAEALDGMLLDMRNDLKARAKKGGK